MTDAMPAGFFLAALANKASEESVADGFKALIHLYYDNNTDATELERDFLTALETLVQDIGGFINFELDEVIREAEAEIRTKARPIRTLQDEED